MPFEKGHKQSGSRKGVENKDKRRFKVKLEEMFENNADKIAGWLDEVAKKDPKEALNQLNRWAEYCHPKLARVETQALDKDGEPTNSTTEVIFIDNKTSKANTDT